MFFVPVPEDIQSTETPKSLVSYSDCCISDPLPRTTHYAAVTFIVSGTRKFLNPRSRRTFKPGTTQWRKWRLARNMQLMRRLLTINYHGSVIVTTPVALVANSTTTTCDSYRDMASNVSLLFLLSLWRAGRWALHSLGCQPQWVSPQELTGKKGG